MRLPRALAAVALLGVAFVGCAGGPTWMAGHEAPRGRTYGPGEYDKASVEVWGREALDTIGYERIMELAEQAGFVTYKPAAEIARADKGLLATPGAAAQVFVRVFTKTAVTAGITSQLDSPAPGPADVVALGILVYGLYQAGVLTIEEIQKGQPSPGTTTAPPPPPLPAVSVTATATATPGTTVAPPIPVPRRCGTEYPDLRVCMSLPPEYIYASEGAALAAMKSTLGKKGLQLHNGGKTRVGPCPGKGMHYNVRLGGQRMGSITCCDCCVEPHQGPRKTAQCRIVW